MGRTGIVAFAFGVPGTIRSNRIIAEIVLKKALKFGNLVYTQHDVDICGIDVTYIEEDGSPPPTLRIARGAIQWAKRRRLTDLWVVAAKPHLWRALRDVQQAVCEVGVDIKVRGCEKIQQYPEYVWFCPDSTQARV